MQKRKIKLNTSQNQLLSILKQQGSVDPDIFISRSNELTERLRTVKQEKSCLLNEKGDDTIARTQELIETLGAGPDFLDTFDGELFGHSGVRTDASGENVVSSRCPAIWMVKGRVATADQGGDASYSRLAERGVLY